MWKVHVIQNNLTQKIYIGCTNDLKKRVEKHNSQTNKGYTGRLRGRWVLIYAEAYRSKEDAFRRESKLKDHGSSKHELKRRISGSLLGPKVRLD